LQRVTRAQKVIVGLGSLGIVVAALMAGPPLPWPLSVLQRGLAAMLSVEDGGAADLSGAYPLSVILQGLVVVGGAVVLWIATSWRLGKFAPATLAVYLTGGLGLLLMASRSSTATLWTWIVIAALAIAYIHYYRKGRFGYTRGATAAVFSYLTLIAFFIGFPLVLIEVLGGAAAVSSVADGGVTDAVGEDATDARDSTAGDECSIMEMTSQGCPDGGASEAPASEDAISLAATDYPPHDVRSAEAGERIDVATDVTSPEELRALFDLQRALVDPRIAGESPNTVVSDFDAVARNTYANLVEHFGPPHESVEIRIRCASVPDLPDADPVLATGWFALSERGAEQIGLASADQVLFETTDRRDCTPLQPPSGAVTADEVFAAVEQAGLEITNPRASVVGDPTVGGSAASADATAVGLSPCYAFGCVQQTRSDQLTVTVWPTAELAEAALALPSDEVAGGALALEGFYGPLAWLAIANAVADPFRTPAARFGPVTTVHLAALDHRTYADAIGCRDPDVGNCVEAYKERVEAAATSFEQATPR
jgi:hypothetical protein